METTTASSSHDGGATLWAAIRRATPDDAAAIADCLSAAFAPYRDSYTPDAFRDTTLSKGGVEKRIQEMTLLVAVDDSGHLIGTVAYRVVAPAQQVAKPDDETAKHGHLRGMAVLPQWRGSGAAAGLLAAAEQALRELGCERVTLNTTRPLDRAVRFYEKRGYARTGTVGDYYGMQLFEYAKTL